MLFSPKKHERFISALRCRLQNQTINEGLDGKKRTIYKKLILFRALYGNEAPIPTDITALADALLGAAVILKSVKGHSFTSEIEQSSTRLVPRFLFTTLLCSVTACETTSEAKITLFFNPNQIILVLKGVTVDATVKKIIKRLSGGLVYLDGRKTAALYFSAPKTEESAAAVPSELDFLLDPLSPANIFI